jgi:hypothetical protein
VNHARQYLEWRRSTLPVPKLRPSRRDSIWKLQFGGTSVGWTGEISVPTILVFGYSLATWIAHSPNPVPISTKLSLEKERLTYQGWFENDWSKNVLSKEKFGAVLKVCKSTKFVFIVGERIGGVFHSMESNQQRNLRFTSSLHPRGSGKATR